MRAETSLLHRPLTGLAGSTLDAVKGKEDRISDLGAVYNHLSNHRDELSTLRERADSFIARAKGVSMPSSLDVNAPRPETVSEGTIGEINLMLADIDLLTSDLRDRLVLIGKVRVFGRGRGTSDALPFMSEIMVQIYKEHGLPVPS
jgi:hypothetical protein